MNKKRLEVLEVRLGFDQMFKLAFEFMMDLTMQARLNPIRKFSSCPAKMELTAIMWKPCVASMMLTMASRSGLTTRSTDSRSNYKATQNYLRPSSDDANQADKIHQHSNQYL